VRWPIEPGPDWFIRDFRPIVQHNCSTIGGHVSGFCDLNKRRRRSMLWHMKAIGYGRVSTDRQAEQGVSLEAQEAKIHAMATVQRADLRDVIVDGGESAKSLNRPGLQHLLELINASKVEAVIVAKLDRTTRSVKDLCGLLELFEKRKVALISVAESLDTGSAAGRLVITIMGAVSQWEREAIGERTRDALRHKRGRGERVGNIGFGYRLAADGVHIEPDPAEQAALTAIRRLRSGGHSLRAVAGALNNSGYARDAAPSGGSNR
jgi:site-specific DNA recombinase